MTPVLDILKSLKTFRCCSKRDFLHKLVLEVVSGVVVEGPNEDVELLVLREWVVSGFTGCLKSMIEVPPSCCRQCNVVTIAVFEVGVLIAESPMFALLCTLEGSKEVVVDGTAIHVRTVVEIDALVIFVHDVIEEAPQLS